jgi:hypothetical protein
MSLLYRRRVFGAIQQSAVGTPGTLDTSHTFFCFDPIPQAQIAMHERVATGSLGELKSIAGPTAGKVSFSLELAGSGTSGTPTPAWATALLPCCGYVASGNIFSPTSNPANFKVATIGVYESGVLKLLTDAMGTFSVEGENGKPGMVKFDFSGIWVAPTDVTMLALPSFPITPPRFAAATFTVGGFTPKISKFSLAAGNTVKYIDDLTKASGYSQAIVTERKIRGGLDPIHELVGTWDAFGQWIGNTTQAMSMAIGSVAGNIVTIAAPAFQIDDNQEGNRDGIVTLDTKFKCNDSAGDDSLTITFS